MPIRSPGLKHASSFLALLTVVLAVGCTAGATSPSPGLTLTCPAAVVEQSADGNPVAVAFQTPPASGGVPPIVTTCSSQSGALFPVGTTTVSCQAVDNFQRTASCSFPLTVKGPPRLAYTRYLAFGDSITEGIGSEPVPGLRFLAAEPYPAGVRLRLSLGYTLQTFTVVNAGIGGETAQNGASRFRGTLQATNPEVVLLMEGTNDLLDASGADAAIAALDVMIGEAQSRNVRVLLATVPPQRPDGARNRGVYAARVPPFNDQVRALAAARGVILVDVFNAMANNMSLIGVDDLHPTDQGFGVIADTFVATIRAHFDISNGPTPTTPSKWR